MNKFAVLRPSNAKVQQESLPERKPERNPERAVTVMNDERAARMDIVENVRNETPVMMLGDHNTHVLDRNSILAKVPYGKEFRFHGRVLANCIRGRVSVMGYTMSPSDDFMLPCYAPLCLPPVSFTSEASSYDERVSELINYFSEAAKAFVFNCTNESVLLLARLNDGLEQLDSINVGGKIFSGLQGYAFEGFFPNTPLDAGVFSFSEEWSKAADSICGAESLQRVVVYGLKNSGKSTFCKYLVNRMLASGIKRIAYLDSDAGQCEFSPPGYLSIVLVESPLIGPNFTHMKKHVIKSCFFGNVAADADPDRYLQNVLELYSFYKNNMMSHNIPLVINTHGWLKGLGYDAFVQFHDTVQPTALFQLTQLNKKNNDVPSIEGEILIPSALNGKSCLSAKDLRTLSMASYFALAGEHEKFGYQLYDFTPLSKRVPVFVSFDDISVEIKDAEDLDPLDKLLVLNASVLSLQKSNGDHLGLALIRAIIPSNGVGKAKGSYFIVSPYSAEELHQESVNVMVRRNINLPPELFFLDRESNIPYGDLYHAESVQMKHSVRKPRRNLLRKRLSGP